MKAVKHTPFVIIVIIALCLCKPAMPQRMYSAQLQDIGTRMPMPHCKVYANNSGKTAFSDAIGRFSLAVQDQDNEEPQALYLHHNTLFLSSEQWSSVQLYSLAGALLHEQLCAPNSSSMYLKVPPAAFYILRVYGASAAKQLLLYSDGEAWHQLHKSGADALSAMYDTALCVSPANYYPRSIPLQQLRADTSIYMLQKQYDTLDYFLYMMSHEAFEMLHVKPLNENYGQIQSIKALYDFVHDTIYYSNVKNHHSHFRFAQRFLGYPYDDHQFAHTQFSLSSDRFLNLITINYHQAMDIYVMEFSPFDKAGCDMVEDTYRKVRASSFFGHKLYLYANRDKWKDCVGVPIITAEELYAGQQYQALNAGQAYGYLRKVDAEQLSHTYLSHHDIAVLNNIPNDVSVVSAIITTVFQTPLSHINLLSKNRHTPNMAFKDAWDSPRMDSLWGQLVYLHVTADDFELRKATLAEAQAYWAQHEPQDTIVLPCDTLSQGLINLAEETILSVEKVGGKAANFAELIGLQQLPLPEDAFAIPFYYYWQHMTRHGLHSFVEQMLATPKFYSNMAYRHTKLYQLQHKIVEADLDTLLLSMVRQQIDDFAHFDAYRFRSSTNAEDLPFFNGAGLYASCSAKKDSDKKTIAQAIKKVWASLWSIRAFEERAYYKIAPQTVAMGVLVHRSFPHEDANGVAITTNLYNDVFNAYTINAQYQDYSIVYPPPGVFYDQCLVHTLASEHPYYTIEYLSSSNLPQLHGEHVLSNEELYQLADYCGLIKNHYYHNIAQDTSCGGQAFAVDIEFKIDSEVSSRKLYIKQARILRQ